MTTEARLRIDEHRLMRAGESPPEVPASGEDAIRAQKRMERTRTMRRVWIHLAIFVVSFMFTAGFGLVSVLLWVSPDGLLALVIIGVAAASVFVATFAGLRIVILHRLMYDYFDKEEDPGMEHHLAKSVAYGFVALVFAMVLVGLLISTASAGAPASV
jgi:cytochrome b561